MKYAEYLQQIDYLPFPLEDLPNRLNSRRSIKEWAYCVHDKDVHDDGTPKAVHVHVMMAFVSDQTAQNVAKWFDDRPSQVEKGKTPTNTYDNMLRYLIHEIPSADGKYHYSDDEVVANFDFHDRMENIRHGVKNATEKRKKHPLADVLEMICNDEIPRLKIGNYVSNLDRIKYKRDIDNAYNIRDERVQKEVDRQMDVMYFCGQSGTGKSTLAKSIARDKGYDIFVSGSSNDPLQGYLGQECIILDDIRGSDWKINDLLKMLDNHMNSLVKSRYSNKLLNDCKLIILTSVQTIEELYRNLSNNDREPIEQLKRRCGTYVLFTETRLKFYQYSEGERDYIFVEETINPVPFMEFVNSHSDLTNDMINMVSDMAKKNGVDINAPVKEMQHFVQISMDDEIASNDEDLPFE